MHVGVGVDAAGDGACLYDGHVFSVVEGWHGPTGRRTREPRPLAQDGQIRAAPPAAATKTWAGRQIDSQDNRSGVSRFAGQAGPRPYARTTANHASRAGSTKTILPADYVSRTVRQVLATWAMAVDGDSTALAAIAEPDVAYNLLHPTRVTPCR